MKDLEEVVQSLDSTSKEAKMLKESKAAKRLFKRVNKMINNMDKVIEDLSKKEQALKQEQTKEAIPEVDSKQQWWGHYYYFSKQKRVFAMSR